MAKKIEQTQKGTDLTIHTHRATEEVSKNTNHNKEGTVLICVPGSYDGKIVKFKFNKI